MSPVDSHHVTNSCLVNKHDTSAIKHLMISVHIYADFSGCMDTFLVDGAALPFDGSSLMFVATPTSESDSSATSCDVVVGAVASDGGVPVVAIVVSVFFVLLLLCVLLGFMIRYRH